MIKTEKLINYQIKALIFDIGGVLFLPKSKKEKHILSSFRETNTLLKKYGIDASNSIDFLFDIYRKSSIGEISKEETLDLMSKELKISKEKLADIYKTILQENTYENVKLYDYILKLKQNTYKIAILSNQFHLSKDVLTPKKYYKNFDALVISCEDKLRKPNIEAFKLIIKKLGLKPEETLLIDDKQENLDIAETLNMKTNIFINNKQLFTELSKQGIK